MNKSLFPDLQTSSELGRGGILNDSSKEKKREHFAP